MEKFGKFLITIGVCALVFLIVSNIVASYQYSKNVLSYWKLADKSSTIVEKSRNLDLFVAQFSDEKYKGKYDAVIFKTPDNSFDGNFKALTSMQLRLQEIKTMDVSSFEYQTAIQQITAQEQGEAFDILDTLNGIWYKVNYFYLWDWIGFTFIILSVAILSVGLMIRFW